MNVFFDPKNIAVIGATSKERTVGEGLMKNLLSGKERNIFPVNPYENDVLGIKTYSNISSIPEKIDLAIVAVPEKYVSEVIVECSEKEVGGVIVISAGFGEMGEKGKTAETEIKKILDEKNIPLIGPNCLGVIRPSTELNASFASATPKLGEIAFISQSGALINSVIDGAYEENYGFSFLVSPGNAVGLSLIDYIKWADDDAETEVIALYIEGVGNGRELYETLKKINKPVVMIKGGKNKQAQKAVSSHTGSLAGESAVFSGVMKQAGVYEVFSLEELFDVCKALAWQKSFKGGISIITNGGGAGVLMTDNLEGFFLPEPEEKTLLLMESKMHPGYSASNPLDIIGDASAERYEVAIEAMSTQENIRALIVIQTLQIMTDPEKNAKIMVDALKKHNKTMLACFMGKGEKTKKAIEFLEKSKIPNYQDPHRVARALKALIEK